MYLKRNSKQDTLLGFTSLAVSLVKSPNPPVITHYSTYCRYTAFPLLVPFYDDVENFSRHLDRNDQDAYFFIPAYQIKTLFDV